MAKGRRGFWLLLLVVAALAAACGAAATPTPTATPSAAVPSPSPVPSGTGPAPTLTPSLAVPSPVPAYGSGEATATAIKGEDTVVQLAVQDLSKRLGADPAKIVIKSVQSVNWPDTSLGCPQPGMMYAQVITPGYKVVLTVGGKDYTYHTSRNRATLCSGG